MTFIFLVIVGFFHGIRGWKLSFEGRLNSCKSMMKNQGAPFYRNGSPFDLKISDFWLRLYPFAFLVDSNVKGWVHWVSHSHGDMTSLCLKDFSAFSPPRSLHSWVFCPIR